MIFQGGGEGEGEENKIKRLPVIDPTNGTVLHIITSNSLVKYLHENIKVLPDTSSLRQSIKALGIGTYGNILTIKDDSTVKEVIEIFVKNRISGVPMIDEAGCLVDLYFNADVMDIAATQSYTHLDMTLKEAHHGTTR